MWNVELLHGGMVHAPARFLRLLGRQGRELAVDGVLAKRSGKDEYVEGFRGHFPAHGWVVFLSANIAGNAT
jgi:hypothetical protein